MQAMPSPWPFRRVLALLSLNSQRGVFLSFNPAYFVSQTTYPVVFPTRDSKVGLSCPAFKRFNMQLSALASISCAGCWVNEEAVLIKALQAGRGAPSRHRLLEEAEEAGRADKKSCVGPWTEQFASSL